MMTAVVLMVLSGEIPLALARTPPPSAATGPFLLFSTVKTDVRVGRLEFRPPWHVRHRHTVTPPHGAVANGTAASTNSNDHIRTASTPAERAECTPKAARRQIHQSVRVCSDGVVSTANSG